MEKLTERIKKHEGLMLKPYHCPAGKLSIGYGRNLEDVGISEKEADFLLNNDIQRARHSAEQFSWFEHLNCDRQDVIVEMIFNLGFAKFLDFRKMRQAIVIEDYDEAAKQMLDSIWARQVGDRAESLAKRMLLG